VCIVGLNLASHELTLIMVGGALKFLRLGAPRQGI
jgi:hypothetical protein